jgi:hypothetical protein
VEANVPVQQMLVPRSPHAWEWEGLCMHQKKPEEGGCAQRVEIGYLLADKYGQIFPGERIMQARRQTC